ncbi:MAG: hypothetical protein KA766_16560 [Piscinibacter sp.]|uniref:hypothetical protein n=1 Tax=Piscinibacter sp. TaxID=1903157 RepID=UPI001B63B454|nr:hypothetical protein [Piscinibacter sp.]MBP5991614.1 hypothetical protein [Piscinibacter sp.]MBP6028977.1 hypothetical protein [Piscinibacter sp.]
MSRFLLALCLAVFAIACRAADRPYIVANSGAAEEDEEQVWAVENWVRQAGHQKSFTIAPEYAFSPDNSLQAEFRRVLDRDRGNGHEIEIEFKHLFNRIAREGWGWGVVLALDMERPEGGPWTHAATSLSLPLTLQLDEASKSLLHLNLGVAKPKEERRVFTGVIAAEREVWRRTSLFAEAARDREGRLLHAGVRHWIKRERLALDIAWQRVRSDELRGSGIVLGLAWYDL